MTRIRFPRPDLRRRAVICLAALLLTVMPLAAHAEEILVSAAASLSEAFKAIGVAFEKENGGNAVRFNFAASGALLQQIARGAPVDVFASADAETMDRAERERLLRPASRFDFAANSLVVVVPHDAVRLPRSLEDLATAPFRRLAFGVPASVPAGRYAKAALEQAGLWPAIEPKVIGAQSVRQALDYVSRGEVDAGFVYATDAVLMADKVRIAFVVPTPTPVRYPIAVVAASAHRAMALKFVAYIGSAPAQALLARQGFARP